MCDYRQLKSCLLVALLFVFAATSGCGPDGTPGNPGGDGPTCDTPPEPEEMEDCSSDAPGGFRTSEQVEWLCRNRCRTVDGIQLYDGPLEDLSFLAGITEVEAKFEVEEVHGLERLDGVGNIQRIGTGDVRVYWQVSANGDLVTTEGFDSLEEVRVPYMRFWGNDSLVDVAGFPELHTVDGDLIIDDNYGLERISGFQSLELVTGDVRVTDNPELDDCEAQDLVDRIDTIEGDVIIRNSGSCV